MLGLFLDPAIDLAIWVTPPPSGTRIAANSSPNRSEFPLQRRHTASSFLFLFWRANTLSLKSPETTPSHFMAGKPEQGTATGAKPYLSPAQQDLLLAALNYRTSSKENRTSTTDTSAAIKPSVANAAMTGAEDPSLFFSPDELDNDSFDMEYTPDWDNLDGDNSFDFENADLGGEMIGALPGNGTGTDANGELHEKRKSPDESSKSEGGDAKRQETQEGEKGAKKPGRKPLTSEPTTVSHYLPFLNVPGPAANPRSQKRKAQNRAAQRAFRERKEKHLKDLETKVDELTEEQEANKQENGQLKAQVEKLQTELREYRKRLSLNGPGYNRSPPLIANAAPHRSNSGPSNSNNFQFDFPKFGGLPGSQMFGDQTVSAAINPSNRKSNNSPTSGGDLGRQSRTGSASRDNKTMGTGLSPKTSRGKGSNTGSPFQLSNMNPMFSTYSTNDNMHGFADTLTQMNGGNDPFGDLFSPSILRTASVDDYMGTAQPTTSGSNGNLLSNPGNDGDTTAGLARVFQFNSGSSMSDSTSPGASSSSQWNGNGTGNSSNGTSPESSHDSPANNHKNADTFVDNNGTITMSEFSQLSNKNMASQPNGMGFETSQYSWPAVGELDPILFGGYRENNDGLLNGTDLNNGFFDDALNTTPFDYASPSNLFGILQSPQQTDAMLNPNHGAANAPTPSRNLMAEIDKTRDGGDDDYGLPNVQPKKSESEKKLISCNSIWSVFALLNL